MHSSRKHTTHSSSHQAGVCLSTCWDTPHLGVGLETPQVWAWRPPWVWAWRPPQVWACRPPWPDPSSSPLGCGPGNLQGMLGYTPLETCKACWDTTCKACWDTTPPPTCEQKSWHTLLKILPCPNFVEAVNIGLPPALMSWCLLLRDILHIPLNGVTEF